MAFIADGTAINSRTLQRTDHGGVQDRRSSTDLEAKGLGRAAVNYKLRDWLFSRQHFWGEPFPILHELDAARPARPAASALRPDELPLDLPET